MQGVVLTWFKWTNVPSTPPRCWSLSEGVKPRTPSPALTARRHDCSGSSTYLSRGRHETGLREVRAVLGGLTVSPSNLWGMRISGNSTRDRSMAHCASLAASNEPELLNRPLRWWKLHLSGVSSASCTSFVVKLSCLCKERVTGFLQMEANGILA